MVTLKIQIVCAVMKCVHRFHNKAEKKPCC